MKLDESIELINKQNILEMEGLKNIDVSEMRAIMTEMMHDENMSSCLYEVLTQEGFLPDEMNEGEDHTTMCEMMIGDDEVMSEMYKSCCNNTSECGMTMQEWMSTKMGHDTEMDEYDKEVMSKMKDQYGNKKGTAVYYATANKQGRDPETFELKEDDPEQSMGDEGHMEDMTDRYMFFGNLMQIHRQTGKLLEYSKEEIHELLENGHDWAEDHIATAKESVGQVFNFFMNEFKGAGHDHAEDHDDDEEMMGGDDTNIPMMEDEEDESINEDKLPAFKPVKGKNVDTDNKNNSSKDGKKEVKDAEKSQKTTEEKVDNLKNQKFSPGMESEFQKTVNQKALGAFNALNLDFQNEVPDSYKKRIEMEVKTGLSRPRDEEKYGKLGNVDYESTERVGEAIWNASQANQGERDEFYKPNPVTVTQDPYQETSISGKPKGTKKNPGGGDLTNESVNKDIERMKKIFAYENKQLEENKKNELSENNVLWKSVSKKKFI